MLSSNREREMSFNVDENFGGVHRNRFQNTVVRALLTGSLIN